MKHSEIHDRIVKVASNLFYSKGYNSTGINEIIDKAGIAKATLYSHFKSKEDICVSYLRYKNDGFIEKISAYCKAKQSGADQILALFDFVHIFFNDDSFNGCWCINTMAEIQKSNDKIRIEILSQKQQLLDFIQDLISKNLTEKTDVECDTLSRKVYLLYESAVTESHLHGKKWPIDDARKICLDILK